MAKKFVLSDDSLNSYGFRTLTAGINIEQFKKNPIMLFMHNRPWRGTTEEYSVIGRWENIRKEKGQLLADAVFDMEDEFAKKIASKVENNFLRMASLGFIPNETSNDPKLILPGQRLETVTKSTAKEASIVDLGANDNSLALCDVPALYDADDKLITLSAGNNTAIPSLKNQTDNMLVQLKDFAAQLNLAETATEQEVIDAIKKQNDDYVALKATKDALDGQKTTLQAKVDELLTAATTAKVAALVDTAAADGKITEAEKPQFTKLASQDFDSVKAILDAKPKHTSIEAQLSADPLSEGERTELNELLKLTGSELYTNGKFERLKKLSLPVYNQRYKEYFGNDPKADNAAK